ncbi:MAG: hypothetical protein JNN30_01695 [Rhodanobacteraceae bacterium]|nr:hypothetical protein [Rhodanobacteraceae bacterium]
MSLSPMALPRIAAAVLGMVAGSASIAAETPSALVPPDPYSQILPDSPVQLEPLHLRTLVDSCMFYKRSVSIELRERTITITHEPDPLRLCVAPGRFEPVDIALGAYPAGDYQVEVYASGQRSPWLRLPFRVSGIGTIAVFPPPPRPIANYSGLWGNAQESGWGLTLEQGGLHQLFGTLYVFDRSRQPQWYTLQAGRWENETRWTGLVVKSEGPPWINPDYPSDGARFTSVGTATLDFSVESAREGHASFRYTIDGTTVEKSISRQRIR